MPAGTARGPDSSEAGRPPRPRTWGATACWLLASLFTVLWLSLQGLAVVYHDPRPASDVLSWPGVAVDLRLEVEFGGEAEAAAFWDGGRDAPPAEPPPADDPVAGPAAAPPQPWAAEPPLVALLRETRLGPLQADGSRQVVAPPGCPSGLYDPMLVELICRAWPEQMAKAVAVAKCESDLGRHPDTYRLDRPHGGPFQLSRQWSADGDGWERYFREKYGWSWDQVVTDVIIHVAAAREVYDRSGGWSPWPYCGLR